MAALRAPADSLRLSGVTYAYGSRTALRDLDLQIARGEVFALLGRNGSGKTTLFRLLSTLLPLQQGEVHVFGEDLRRAPCAVRARMGVVFQSPSLDKKLTVRENIRCQAALYGLRGEALRRREAELLERLELVDRVNDFVESLSGGLRRRVELVQALIHRPQLLLLDEPSTGLDPGARIEFWNHLAMLRREWGVTVVLTTHLLDEADRADRVGILEEGRLAALGRPEELKAEAGGDVLVIGTPAPEAVSEVIQRLVGRRPQRVGGQLRIECAGARQVIGQLLESLRDDLASLTLSKPTLEDVFLRKTGRRLWDQEDHGARDD